MFSLQKYYFTIPNGENVRKWDPKQVSKFHDDSTVEESKIIILLRQVLGGVEKEKATMQRASLSPKIDFRKFQW